MIVHPTHLVLSFATLSNEIFCGSLFIVKNHVFCAYHISKTNFILQPQQQGTCRRLTQCSSTPCECSCTWLIWCCPLQPFQMRYFVVHFDWKSCYLCAYHNSKTNFIPQPHGHKCCRRQRQCSSTLCGCLCTWLIWCCPLQPFQMRYGVVHFDQKSYCLCAYHISKLYFIPQPHEQKNGWRQPQCSNTLCGGICTWLNKWFFCNPFKWDIVWFILTKILDICVPSTTAKQIYSSTRETKNW